MKRAHVFCIAIVVMVACGQVFAASYGFTNITLNDPTNAAIGETQLSMSVFDHGSQALFEFYNIGEEACSITQIYFDDSVLSLLDSIAYIDDSDPGVSFSEGASPPNLPGRNAVGGFTVSFSISPDAPTQPNGVNPDETVGIMFNLGSTSSFNELITGVNHADLRVGMHVQGFESGGSESYIHVINSAPMPATAWLGAALLLATLARRRPTRRP